ncbi:hypothetical protein DH2020_010885 [Rehmannia glutinosa]|uniref:RNase H type-1 domain-containing protein n=1 Tax=Rehmannia glutinosa TaxID=99300 RepID=A0ABR0XBW6_REHGL
MDFGAYKTTQCEERRGGHCTGGQIKSWRKPSPGQFRFDVDVCFNPKEIRYATGGVVRNDEGKVIMAFGKKTTTMGSALEGELFALKAGLQQMMEANSGPVVATNTLQSSHKMLTFKATHMVQPAEPTPEEIMYLNAGDQIKDIYHTPTIYFYKHSPALHSRDAISRLKESLSKVLVPFYPLAGRLSWAAEGGSRVELHCNGKGVPIIEAESDAAVEDYGDFTPTPAIQDLIPIVDYTIPIDEIPLISVQLTTFRCGGVSIGLGVCHVMADGPSALHFVDEWAKIGRGAEEPVIPPFLDRKVLETDKPLTSIFDPAVLRPLPTLIGQEDNIVEQQKKPLTVTTLNLNKSQIDKLREKANLDYPGGRGYSRFEAVAAHIWRCTSKARGHVAEQQTSLNFVADFRNKMKPPLPNNFFGNALIRVEARDNSGNLLSNSIGMVASKIREATEKVTDDTVRAYLDYVKGLPDVGVYRSLDNNGRPKGGYFGNPNVAIISWTTLSLYGADFGWGKEIHMGPGSHSSDGKTYIIPSHDGDGSFNVVIWLVEEHMGAFKKCFYEEI